MTSKTTGGNLHTCCIGRGKTYIFDGNGFLNITAMDLLFLFRSILDVMFFHHIISSIAIVALKDNTHMAITSVISFEYSMEDLVLS